MQGNPKGKLEENIKKRIASGIENSLTVSNVFSDESFRNHDSICS